MANIFRAKRKKECQPVERFTPDINYGLTAEQVELRLSEGLVNKDRKTYTKSYGEIFRDNILTFFNILLFVIAGALIYVKAYSSLFFLVIQFSNIIIGVIQDIRAKKKIAKLRLVTAPNAKVRREGKEGYLSANLIVLDDILVLVTGNQIISDAIIMEGSIEVNESLLTGEAIAIKKRIGDLILAGSYVTSGTCVVKVEKTGANNYANTLQTAAKAFNRPKSELLRALNKIFRWISFIIIPLGAVILIGNIIQHNGKFSDAIIATTAGSLVGMIPAGMFLLTSMTLSVGVVRLATKRTLVQELYCIEMLARVDVICLDKTGTITDGSMQVEEIIVFPEFEDIDLEEIMGSYLSSIKDENQTSKALINKFGKKGIFTPCHILPFSSERKYSAVSFANKGTFVLGAPEYVYRSNDKKTIRLIDENMRRGHRVIMLTYSNEIIKQDKVDLIGEPVALFILHDHVRDDAPETLKWFAENGVEIKIISGDNPVSVAEIAHIAGVPNAKKYVSLEGRSLEEVAEVASEYTVFGRVSPEQKAEIIKSLRKRGRTPAMVGDGVNDILALKNADCSIAMAQGSSAARNVSHLVLLDSNFSVLPDVVAEGRRVINNLQNVASLFLVKTFFTIIFSIIWIVVMMANGYGGGKTYPFETNHLYLWEFASIGVASFFMAMEPSKKQIKGSFISNVVSKAVPGGLVMILVISSIQIISLFDHFDANQALLISVISMIILSLVILFRISLPFNKFRVFVFCFISIGTIGLAVLFALSKIDDDVLKISFRDLTFTNWIIALVANGIGIFVYFILDWLFCKKILKLRKKETQ